MKDGELNQRLHTRTYHRVMTREFWAELTLAVLAALALAAFLWPATWGNPCDPESAGTDYWYEVCLNEGDIDLGADQIQGRVER